MSAIFSLQQLGWRAFFSQQLTLEDLESHYPARIASVHRSGAVAISERGEVDVAVPRDVQCEGVAAVLTVGDWVLVERDAPRMRRRLERSSAIVRIAAGGEARPQAIAANVDTLFVVTSCNHDFNPSRLERYMAVALDAGVEPVVVLTKTDLCEDPDAYIARARLSAPRAEVTALNATSSADVLRLEPWLAPGRTVAFAGSSGVGKSTLVNTLLSGATGKPALVNTMSGAERAAGDASEAVSARVAHPAVVPRSTAAIREDDSRGRHTTTARQLLPMRGGAWLIDTPGMRELRIGAVEEGVGSAFDDVTALALGCRFRDCRHDGDEGCAVQAAVGDGRLDPRRFASYRKLQREAAHAARALHERRASDKRTGKLYKAVQASRRRERGKEER